MFAADDYADGGFAAFSSGFAETAKTAEVEVELGFGAAAAQLLHRQQQQQQRLLLPENFGNELKVVEARQNPFITGYDPSSPEEMAKRQARAERFGVPLFYHGMEVDDDEGQEDAEVMTAADPVEQAEAAVQRTEKFGVVDFEIDLDGPEREHYMMDLTSARRWDALLLFGTKLALDNVKSRHVLEYYSPYGAKQVAWLDAVRCLVIFGDPGGARRAMMNTSSPMIRRSQLDEDTSRKLETIGAAPHDFEFLCWRVCQTHSPASSLLCRVATVMDVKAPLEERRKSKFYSMYWKRNLDELMHRKQRQAEKEASQARPKSISLKEVRRKRGMEVDSDEDFDDGQHELEDPRVRSRTADHGDQVEEQAMEGQSVGPIRPRVRGRGSVRAFGSGGSAPTRTVVLRRQ